MEERRGGQARGRKYPGDGYISMRSSQKLEIMVNGANPYREGDDN